MVIPQRPALHHEQKENDHAAVGGYDKRILCLGHAFTYHPAAGLIPHSDRCSQYCAQEYSSLLGRFGMWASMSRKGNCYDNAPMESLGGY